MWNCLHIIIMSVPRSNQGRGSTLILYKYYGFSAGLSALQSSQLGFRTPKDFNDPFELTFLSNATGPNSKLSQLDSELEELKGSVAILSLTRTPLNPLMWAHYGEAHTGIVIGYETNDEFLTSQDYNLVPVDDGDVVYTNTKSSHALNPASMRLIRQVYLAGQGVNLSPSERAQISSLIRRVFLTKHSSWVYEEEVRIVKVWQSLFETSENYQGDPLRAFHHLLTDVAPGHACQTVSGLLIYYHPVKIKEVYLGVRNPLLIGDEGEFSDRPTDSRLVEKADNEKWRIHALNMSRNSWELEPGIVTSSVLAIRKKSKGLINSFEFSGQEASFLKNMISRTVVSEEDKLELTNWGGQCYLKVNGKFIET